MSYHANGQENHGEHTNQLVPLYASGPGSELFNNHASHIDYVRDRYVDNTDVGHVMHHLWQNEISPLPQPKKYYPDDQRWLGNKPYRYDRVF